MNIEEAKSIQLEDYLRRMGFNPVKQQGDTPQDKYRILLSLLLPAFAFFLYLT